MKLTLGLLAQEDLEAAGDLCQDLMLLLGDTDPDKLKYLTQGITAVEQRDLKLATRNIRKFLRTYIEQVRAISRVSANW